MSATESEVQALSDELKQLRSEFVRLGQLLESTARTAGTEAAQAARATGEKAWGEVRRSADELAGRIEGRPITSAAVAFGIGVILGLLFGRR
ncbi:MAG TPA: hypothetical protein VGK90_12625 [Rhizomicrobium sp.]|jgi:ElaB/YqjD/DUF883 family membrane-anchored ribosome-binding protein